MSEEIANLLESVTAGEWGKEQDAPEGINIGVIRSANFTKEHQFNKKDIVIRSIDERKLQKKMLLHGDILIEKSGGSPEQPVGRVLFYDLEGDHTCSNFISILRPTKRVDSKFLYYSLCNLYRTGVVKNYQQQTTGIINLQLGEYLREKIHFPPLHEQKKIAVIISSIDELLENYKRSIYKYINLKKSFLNLYFSPLNLKNRNLPVYSLMQIAEGKYGIVDGPFGSNLKSEHYRERGIPIIQSGFVTSGKFLANQYKFVDYKKYEEEIRSSVFPDDLVIAKIGARAGSSALLPENHPNGIIAGNCIKITPRKSLIKPKYLAILMQYLYQNGELKKITNTTAQPAVSMSQLKNMKLILPKIEEQQKIIKLLSSIDVCIENLDRQISKMFSIKSSLTQDLISGHKRVNI